MWPTIETDLLPRLPAQMFDGATGNWSECFAKLEEYRAYTDDWDGQRAYQGKPAKAITGAVVDSAVALAELLRSHSIAPPYAFPGFGGNVLFEWQWQDGTMLEIDVLSPGVADVDFMPHGQPVQYWRIPEVATTGANPTQVDAEPLIMQKPKT